MNKIAAIRSQARRVALTKAAAPAPVPQVPGQLVEDYIRRVDPNYTLRGLGVYERMVDPANVGATAGIAGGAGLLGSALFNKDQSTGARIAKGIAGAGLAGGGTILATNDKARDATRKFVIGMLGRAAEPFRTKYAEAQLTPEEQAFAAGFCKAAEAMGVDPAALYKAADGVSDWVDANLPDYTPQERLVQELKAKKDRGVDIEKYRTSNVGNVLGTAGGVAVGTLAPYLTAAIHMKASDAGERFLGSARGWIHHLRRLAPTASARHPGVTKAIGRLLNTGVKGGAYALPILAALGIAGKFNQRRAVNKAIDQVQGSKQ